MIDHERKRISHKNEVLTKNNLFEIRSNVMRGQPFTKPLKSDLFQPEFAFWGQQVFNKVATFSNQGKQSMVNRLNDQIMPF